MVTDDVPKIVNELVDEMSSVSDHVSDTDLPPTVTDSVGTVFDPSKHRALRDGSPKILRNGKYSNFKIGGSAPESVTPQNPDVNTEMQSLAAATQTVDLIQVVTRMLGGDEFAYLKDKSSGLDERESGIDVFKNYYNANGIKDIPPGWAIVVWAVCYASPRFFMPKTKTRMTRLKIWIKKLIRSRRSTHNVTEQDSPGPSSPGPSSDDRYV